MRRLLFLFVLFLVFVQPAHAATVSGTVYSLYLDVLDGAIVEVDSEPRQVMVAKGGDYSFSLEPGEYRLRASYRNDEVYFIEEDLAITNDDGEYVIDLILLPDFSSNDLEGIEEDLTFPEPSKRSSPWFLWIALGLGVVLGAVVVLWRKRVSPRVQTEGEILSEPEEDVTSLLSYLKQHDGRATQKDIRKNFSWSESKISLMLAELEDAGQVKKIKRGRSNIVILQKR